VSASSKLVKFCAWDVPRAHLVVLLVGGVDFPGHSQVGNEIHALSVVEGGTENAVLDIGLVVELVELVELVEGGPPRRGGTSSTGPSAAVDGDRSLRPPGVDPSSIRHSQPGPISRALVPAGTGKGARALPPRCRPARRSRSLAEPVACRQALLNHRHRVDDLDPGSWRCAGTPPGCSRRRSKADQSPAGRDTLPRSISTPTDLTSERHGPKL
jgi:hypothetical protein